MTTAIIGVGNIGGTVARALASGGEPVLLSATSSDKVQKLAAEIGTPATAALDNRDAIQRADAVILALWLDSMKAVIDEVADLLPGKLVIDPSNPIAIAADGTISRTLPDGQSAGEVVASWLPQGTRYAKAFGTLSAPLERELRYLYGTPCGDVLPWVAAGAAEAHRAYPPARAGVRQPLPRSDPDRQPATRTGSRARAGQPLGR
jgi:hypothetical protein